MQESFRRILTGTIFFVLTNIIGVIGYQLFGWTLLDSVYMVVITVFGVGYGEIQPLETPAEKIFTIVFIIAGTSSAVYTVGGFLQMITAVVGWHYRLIRSILKVVDNYAHPTD